MAETSATYGADTSAVATIHAVRVTLVVLILPAALTLFLGSASIAPASAEAGWGYNFLIALSAGGLAGWGASLVGLSAAYFLGPMIMLALLSGAGLVEAQEPASLLAGAQIALGMSLGSRFRPETIGRLPHAIG